MDTFLFNPAFLWVLTAAWMQAVMLAFVMLTLVTMLLLGGAGAVVVAWLISPRARRWIDERTTTPQQRKRDRNLAKLDDDVEMQLEDLVYRPVVIDAFSDIPV